ncbi:MAG: hypothetical protein HY020_02000 [Burkholderiales bacterium]|nr:hypothetical protein [Burkholderiales bacterium]
MSSNQASKLREAPLDDLGDFGNAPVELALYELLSGPLDAAALKLLHRYQRKLDISRKLVQRYADDLGAAMSEREVSRPTYLGLARTFAAMAAREPGDDEDSRARLLRYVNSAFNCVDKLDVSDPYVADLQSRLDLLASEGVQCPNC